VNIGKQIPIERLRGKLKQMTDIPDKQIKRLRSLIAEAETALAATKELLVSLVGEDSVLTEKVKDKALGKVIEGVFDGQNMVGSDSKTYPVPANYASKSKLVQGDILKLSIADDGAFMYKQIGPIPRRQVVGVLNQKDGHFFVDVDGFGLASGEKLINRINHNSSLDVAAV
jgi:hypothetical protein